jgi:hypothetical protein
MLLHQRKYGQYEVTKRFFDNNSFLVSNTRGYRLVSHLECPLIDKSKHPIFVPEVLVLYLVVRVFSQVLQGSAEILSSCRSRNFHLLIRFYYFHAVSLMSLEQKSWDRMETL